LEKEAKAVAKSKNAKISLSKLNLKVQNIYIKPLLNSCNTNNKPYFYQIIHPGHLKVAKMAKFCQIWSHDFNISMFRIYKKKSKFLNHNFQG
jgi:hypothetical protein